MGANASRRDEVQQGDLLPNLDVPLSISVCCLWRLPGERALDFLFLFYPHAMKLTNPIESLTITTLHGVREIGHAFASEVAHPGGFNYEAFEKHWGPVLETGIGELYAIRDGRKIVAILGCAFVPDCFSGMLTACEQFWYVLPEYRGASIAGRLFNAFENEAIRRGCKKIIMARLETPQAEQLDALYIKRGYRPVEKTFGKEI